MRAHRRNRRALAICAALLWLVGIEVLPNLHLALHEADHTHAADGTIIIARDAAERERIAHLLAHADGAEHSHAAKSKSKSTSKSKSNGELAYRIAVDLHAAAGLAHHATALLDPPLPIVAPLAAPHAETWRHLEPTTRTASAFSSRPTARGPPVA